MSPDRQKTCRLCQSVSSSVLCPECRAAHIEAPERIKTEVCNHVLWNYHAHMRRAQLLAALIDYRVLNAGDDPFDIAGMVDAASFRCVNAVREVLLNDAERIHDVVVPSARFVERAYCTPRGAL